MGRLKGNKSKSGSVKKTKEDPRKSIFLCFLFTDHSIHHGMTISFLMTCKQNAHSQINNGPLFSARLKLPKLQSLTDIRFYMVASDNLVRFVKNLFQTKSPHCTVTQVDLKNRPK